MNEFELLQEYKNKNKEMRDFIEQVGIVDQIQRECQKVLSQNVYKCISCFDTKVANKARDYVKQKKYPPLLQRIFT